jgi:hypothetical protein
MIYAVVLDGYHRSTVIKLAEYVPVLRIPKQTSIGIGPDGVSRQVAANYEYHAVFHAVDREVVLYSRTGHSMDFLNCDAVHPILTGDAVGRRTLNHFVKVARETGSET